MKILSISAMRARIVTEISCYMDNEPGMLAALADSLAQKNINIKGIQSYEGQLQCLVRLVVDQEKLDQTEACMRDLGIDLISRPEIIELEISNAVGGLATLTKMLGSKSININSLYSSDSTEENCFAYLRLDDLQGALELFNSSS